MKAYPYFSITSAALFFLFSGHCHGNAEDAPVTPEVKEALAAGPRMGKYIVRSFGRAGSPAIMLGYLVLEPNGVYKQLLPGSKSAGEGTYTYDAGTQTLTWTTGPYAGTMGGKFYVEREGKTHRIYLKSTTSAFNSSDVETK